MKKQSYLKGAIIISIGGFLSKLLGAVYRIPLVAYLGGEGMGIYQMVYPLYCILLTVSASGIPTGIARLISSGGHNGAERKAFYLYGGIGLIGSLLMIAFSAPLAAAQGETEVLLCCQLLSPSVFFVAIISVVRGYFQGKGNMYPTALTEVLEQGVKVAAGIALAGLFRGNIAKATAAAVIAVTLSEVITCCFAAALYLTERSKTKPLYKQSSTTAKAIFAYTVPLTFTAMALPASQLAESIAVVNILRGSVDNATALYGIFSGCAVTIINLPVSVTYGLAAASVPNVSPLAAKGDIKGAKREVRKALLYTLAISLPFAIALYALAPLAARIIFPSLKAGEKALLINLVRIMSINAVTSSLVQTSSACITSLGKPLHGTVTQWVTSVLRVGLSAALVAFTPLSIVGVAVSANVAYFVAVVLNFCYIIMVKNEKGHGDVNNADRIGSEGRGYNPVGKTRA
ncbi:MAG: oligosaccharide flippase family protein [Clostridia bacterium]|nr:oligosaccharide flippase family protein [Clostridia bacterium]